MPNTDDIRSQMAQERTMVDKITQPVSQLNLISKVNEIIDNIEVDSVLSTTSENPVQNKVVTSALETKLETIKVNGTAQTATSGTVDISIPTAQTVGDGNMVIQRNGTAVGTFTANQTSASTINIGVPTTAADVGALPDSTVIGDGKVIFQKNGTSFSTVSANQTATTTVNFTIPTTAADVGALPDSTVIGAGNLTIKRNGTAIGTFGANQTASMSVDITVATAVSQLTNDSGFITGINSSDVTTALGYTPYNSTNPSGYQANVLETVKVNGTALTNTSKTVDITVPKVDQTYNASSTNAQSGTAVAGAVNGLIKKTDLSIASSSANYLEYNNSNGQFGAKVDTTVTAASTNLVTSGAVEAAIGAAIVGGVMYQGTWTATSQTDYSSITLPVKKGYLYYVTGTATIGGIEWSTGDFLLIDADVAVGGTISSVTKIDNTEGADIVRLDATQTLTNKTIDADDNTIKDLTTGNLKSGVLSDSVRATASAASTVLVSEKGISKALADKYDASNPAGYISGINSSDVTTALGYTPYNSTNPSGYEANVLETVKVNGTALTATSKTVDVTVPTKVSDLSNDSGFISGITSADVTTALGYTPYNSTNPSGYEANTISTVKVNGTALTPSSKTVDITIPAAPTVGSGNLTIKRNGTAVGTFNANATADSAVNITVATAVSELTNDSGFITGITSSDVTTALGFTPYSNANPSGYQANVLETVKVNGTALTASSKTVDITVPAAAGTGNLTIKRNGTAIGTFNANATTDSAIDVTVATAVSELTNDSGFITGISSADVTNALGYTPYSNANPSGYEANKIATVKVNGTALTPTSKTVDVTVPTKVSDLSNDSGFISSITSSDVTTALGYTPYSNANPSGYQANVLETVKVNGTALTATSKTVDITIPAATTVGDGDMVIKRNGTAVGTFTANQTAASTINISVPTTASDVGALPDTTTIGNGNMVIKRNSTAVGTFSANQTAASTITISVPTQASDIGALPDTTFIPLVDQTYSASSTNAQSGTAVAGAINDLIKKTDLSIASASANYLSYNNSNGQFGAKVDTTVTAASTNLITSGAVESAIAAAIVGGVMYQGTWTATSQTDYSGITLPVKKGYLYYVTGSATVDGIEWNTGDFLLVDVDVAAGGSLTSAKLSKIDNTEGADIVRLNASQTLTNKTIDASSNTISNLGTGNFVSGAIADSVRATATAASTVLVSEKGIAAALAEKYDSSNPSGYQANVIETVKVNGTALSVTSKAVNITIPAQQTVGDGNMVIQRNGSAVGTFTANQTSASTINISVPTTAADVGALPDSTTIGSGNLTIKRNGTAIGTFGANATSNMSVDVTVPTKVSELTNDSSFISGITSSDVTTALGFTPYNSSNPSGYQANVIETVKVNGTALTPSTKSVNITVPTTASDIGAQSVLTAGTGITINNNTISATGTTIAIDTTMSITSTNPVQNKVITSALENRTVATFTNITSATSADVTNLKVNTLTSAEYATITPSDTELYFITDANTGGATWGDISGTLSDQTDLQTALNAKYDASNPSGYQANVLETVKVNGTALTPTSKTVDVTVPITTTAIASGNTSALTSGGAYSGLVTSVTAGNSGEIVVTKAGVSTTIPVGSSVTIDTSLSTISTNPVENRVITNAINNISLNASYDSVTETLSFALTDLTQIMNTLNTIIAGGTST